MLRLVSFLEVPSMPILFGSVLSVLLSRCCGSTLPSLVACRRKHGTDYKSAVRQPTSLIIFDSSSDILLRMF
ncbi:uncharacterized protein F5891DRAFT_1043664 [Suillus fuscotomentosus]|uniref:Uncharacterized protein n=1 Tax=Suillus fuscotomentosus TaxID=1912939 RepID=A0AAD4E4S3_9AGAM|nr:uncharacterized protein F5891DRAFT_1043664 [Suillus fuscotomentosus]KAG1898489.1 hypothetical protein F5891DRAFT_1043664 [Suillus fuscotomentosus]